MKFFKRAAYLFSNFRVKYRVSVRDPHDEREVWYIYIKPTNIATGILALALVIFIIAITLVAFTPVMDYIPGYQGNKTRNILVESSMKLDSLERQLNMMNSYYDNIVRIMSGKTPLPSHSGAAAFRAGMDSAGRAEEDSILRMQMEREGVYKLQSTAGSGTKNYAEMFTPLRGVIVKSFNPREGVLGVDILSADNMPVSAIMDGTVIAAMWTPMQGSVIYVMHTGNIMSAYLYNSRLMKKTGDRVSAGEVISFTGSSPQDEAGKGFIEFQLWYNGSPVDPENYIVF